MDDPPALYGVDERHSNAVSLAANDLSRLINTLEAHHAEELPAMDEAIAAFVVKFEAVPVAATGRKLLFETARDIETAAVGMRSQRGALLDHLLGLRGALVDVILEAHRSQPPDAMLAAHVEPYTTLPAPKPISGLDLDKDDRVRMLDKTLKWSRQVTYGQAVLALGPCHLLAEIIEHPTPEARKLRADLAEASERLRGFLFRTFQY